MTWLARQRGRPYLSPVKWEHPPTLTTGQILKGFACWAAACLAIYAFIILAFVLGD